MATQPGSEADAAAPPARVTSRTEPDDSPFDPTAADPMPLTPDMRRSIDQIRDYLFGGGYPDPVSNAEQLSFLFFFYLVEGIDAENKRCAPAC
jgi:hypothetical protein